MRNYEIFLGFDHAFNLFCLPEQLIDRLSMMAFLGQSVRVHDVFMGTWDTWDGKKLEPTKVGINAYMHQFKPA